MEFLIVGAGRMGRAIAYDIIRTKNNNTVNVLDINKNNLEDTKNFVASTRLKTKLMDISSPRLISYVLNSNVVIGAASYTINHYLSLFSMEHGKHFCDLGGNPDVVKRQFKLNHIA